MADSICWRWLPAGASRQRGNEPSQALRASSPEGRAKAVEGALPASLLKGCQGRNGSASCLSLWERWLRPSGADGEGAPAPCGELPPQRLRGLQIGEAKKMRLAKRLAFFRFDFSFGIIKGEQPLIRGSSASKSLALFWFSFVRQKRTLSLAKHFRKRPLGLPAAQISLCPSVIINKPVIVFCARE